MENLTFGGPVAIGILVFYAVLLLVIGYFAGRTQPGVRTSSRSYYLAGGGLGFVALFFTLYATQYSGNNIVGYPPEAYRSGFSWWQSVPFMIAVIGAYLLFAPRLYGIAKRRGFVTPTDWIRYRFNSTPVTVLAVLLMLWGLSNYLLEQLVAMGQGISGLTGDTIPYQVGVVAFILVMMAYSWMGGMRAVAFTDILQGIAMLIGIFSLLIGALYLVEGNFADVTQHLIATQPEAVAVPPLTESINWISMIIMIGLGAAVYPHAIQRIYAARSERTLKRSLTFMAWMPLITTAVVFVVGIIGIQLIPGLSESDSEQLVGAIANQVAEINLGFFLIMVLLFGGVIMAIISTADSALLSFSSIISRDLYQRYINPRATEAGALRVGKLAGIALIAVLLFIAWNPPTTLYNIFVLKFEIIVQVAPAFMLGLYWQRLSSGPVFWGMATGATIAGAMTMVGADLYGVPGGLLGLVVNTLICVAGSLLLPAPAATGRSAQPPASERSTEPPASESAEEGR